MYESIPLTIQRFPSYNHNLDNLKLLKKSATDTESSRDSNSFFPVDTAYNTYISSIKLSIKKLTKTEGDLIETSIFLILVSES